MLKAFCLTNQVQILSFRRILSRFFLYNLIFLCFQFAFIFKKSSNFVHAIPLPPKVFMELFATILVHVGLYFFLSLLQSGFWYTSSAFIQQKKRSTSNRLCWILWWLTTIAILTSNAYFFPLSLFSRAIYTFIPSSILLISMVLSLILLSFLLIVSCIYLISRIKHRISTSIIVIFSMVLMLSISFYPPHSNVTKANKPNIILIGIDSLAPERVNATNTPTITQFINQSILFKNTISPLARTYPAWTTILTGLYPKHHFARYNLMPRNSVKNKQSIAWTLQKLGYHTFFATDDRRFNNLGTEFGFQTIVGPKLGVNDFLLGTFNDYPLSNLIVNFPISRWLFPYNYINRASHFSYYPQFFDHELANKLKATSHPAFIAVHFTLPHWPYAFAKSSSTEVNDEYNAKQHENLYVSALKQADQQVKMLLTHLKTNGFLENSLVILLSDHGEALYEAGSRQTLLSNYQGQGKSLLADYFQRKTSTELDKSAGHGSDLLSPSQYRCLLAFRQSQNNQILFPPRTIKTRVSLLDITPTILSFLNLKANYELDGISLLKAISLNHTLPSRSFIMESGMLPNQFLSREKARQLGQKFFRVSSEDGQLHIRKEELATLDAMKLYAIIQGNWVLALYPNDGKYIPIIQRLNDGKWADTLTIDFVKLSPAKKMLRSLEHFYQKKWVIQ